MKKSLEIAQVLKLMEECQSFLITSHKDPDGDSIGSQIGLYYALVNAGKRVAVINQGNLPEKYRFLDAKNVVSFENKPLAFMPEAVFVLECPTLDRTGFAANLIPESALVINIDHHLDNGGYGHINLVDSTCCAVGELIYIIIREGNIPITPIIAQSLYAALICDTGNFRFASTTSRGMKIAAELVEHGANPKLIFDQIFSKSSAATLKLLGYTLESLDVTAGGRISYMVVSRENVRRAGARIEDSEGFVDYSLAVAGSVLGFLFKEVGNGEIKISVRSQNGVDAAAFARNFNGGGHVNASGFTLRGPLFDVVKDVLAKAGEYVERK